MCGGISLPLGCSQIIIVITCSENTMLTYIAPPLVLLIVQWHKYQNIESDWRKRSMIIALSLHDFDDYDNHVMCYELYVFVWLILVFLSKIFSEERTYKSQQSYFIFHRICTLFAHNLIMWLYRHVWECALFDVHCLAFYSKTL